MKLRFLTIATLPLLCSFAALASAQTLEPPPIKMGLWQSESNTSIEGVAANSPMAQAMTHGGNSNVSQGCLTPDTWKSEFQHMQQRHPDSDCNQSNFQQDAHHIAFDETCGGQRGYASNVHFEMLIDDSENAHGHVDVKMTGAAFPQGMTMHMTVKTKYLSSDCGDVKPGAGKVIH
ncbi:MAG TPA: DUF3617 domain-containing protein [Acidobacteriaceae bacterium]|jgi:hypothetical protein|nr:DUF3617 domain-containing protein [Acidobacteriaceae bacterium]